MFALVALLLANIHFEYCACSDHPMSVCHHETSRRLGFLPAGRSIWHPQYFRIRVVRHRRRWKVGNGIEITLRKFRKRLRGVDKNAQCNGNSLICTNQLVNSVGVLEKYHGKKCKSGPNCDIDKALEAAASIMKITLADSVYHFPQNPIKCKDRACWIRQLFRVQRFLLGGDDQDDDVDCEDCAIGDLLGIFHKFIKMLKKVFADGYTGDLRCNKQNWSCLLNMIKDVVERKKGGVCDICAPQYSCLICIKTNYCDLCHIAFGCRTCTKVDCKECMIYHECRFCQRMGCRCDLGKDCERCLNEHGCKYCRDNYGCICAGDFKRICDKCIRKRTCEFCQKQYACHCDSECDLCLSVNSCVYCQTEYNCKCVPTKEEICVDCMQYQDCYYCHDHHGCTCNVECEDCIELKGCDYCSQLSCCGSEFSNECNGITKRWLLKMGLFADRSDSTAKTVRTEITAGLTSTMTLPAEECKEMNLMPDYWSRTTHGGIMEKLNRALKDVGFLEGNHYADYLPAGGYYIAVERGNGSVKFAEHNATGPGVSLAITYQTRYKPGYCTPQRCRAIAVWMFFPAGKREHKKPYWSCYDTTYQNPYSCRLLAKWAEQFYKGYGIKEMVDIDNPYI